MLRRELLVEVEHDHIVARVTGTSYAVTYYRTASSNGLSCALTASFTSRERGAVRLAEKRALVLSMTSTDSPKPPPSRGPIETAQVTMALLAPFLCCFATKSIAPPKQAA